MYDISSTRIYQYIAWYRYQTVWRLLLFVIIVLNRGWWVVVRNCVHRHGGGGWLGAGRVRSRQQQKWTLTHLTQQHRVSINLYLFRWYPDITRCTHSTRHAAARRGIDIIYIYKLEWMNTNTGTVFLNFYYDSIYLLAQYQVIVLVSIVWIDNLCV